MCLCVGVCVYTIKVCLVFSDRSFGEGGVLWISIFASIMNLVILIMSTMYQAELLKCLVKDINENRLSKFEIALGIVKMIEDLVEDVSFSRSPPSMPFLLFLSPVCTELRVSVRACDGLLSRSPSLPPFPYHRH